MIFPLIFSRPKLDALDTTRFDPKDGQSWPSRRQEALEALQLSELVEEAAGEAGAG